MAAIEQRKIFHGLSNHKTPSLGTYSSWSASMFAEIVSKDVLVWVPFDSIVFVRF